VRCSITILWGSKGQILANIAAGLDAALARRREAGARASTTPRTLVAGEGWQVADVLCTHGPNDVPFEERHSRMLVALVVAGAFEYRTPSARALMTPGAVMLGNDGECFECGHRHREGDRCIAFRYTPAYFERIAADVGVTSRGARFGAARIAPSRAFARFVAAACAGVSMQRARGWDALAAALAAHALRHTAGLSPRDTRGASSAAIERVMQILQLIDAAPESELGLDRLAEHAGLSPYHFLRTFEEATGTTPHQYVVRARLRLAAQRLADAPGKIVDIALDCGFEDVSNFNRAFRAEFGESPRAYRARLTG